MVRLAADSDRLYHLFLGADRIARLGRDSYGVFFQNDWAVDDLLGNEVTGLAVSLRDAETEGAALATYSLRGLGEAYEAIREACPERETPNDVLVTGEVVRVEPYVEIAFTGPFAEAGRKERISVKIFPGEGAEEDEYAWPEKSLAAFAAGDDSFPGVRYVDRIEYLRGDALLGKGGGTYHLDFWGVCLDPGSGRIKTVFNHWHGGASNPDGVYMDEFDPGRGLVRESLTDVEGATPGLDCSPGEDLWGEHFRPCSCAAGYPSRLGELTQEIEEATLARAEDISPRMVWNDPEIDVGAEVLADLPDLLERVERISPFMNWDAREKIDVERFASSEYSIVVVTHISRIHHYGSFQHLFVWRPTEDAWTLLYNAPFSSGYFFAAEVYGFVREATLQLTLCPNDCDAMRRATVRLDMERWLEFVGGEGTGLLEAVNVGPGAEASLVDGAVGAAERRASEERSAEVVRAAVASQAEATAAREGEIGQVNAELERLVAGTEMVVIPAGSFRMGCVSGVSCERDEFPVHEVAIPRAFAVSKHEVTFAQWEACVSAGGCPRRQEIEDSRAREIEDWSVSHPVVNVSWEDAQAYVRWLSSETGAEYRLLSESEWEYAARAGTSTMAGWGYELVSVRADCRACRRPLAVGSRSPNAWGLYDMHGNVEEWVQDCWNDRYSGAPSDGSAWQSGDCSRRISRGGSFFPTLWYASDRPSRSAERFLPDPGYRGTDLGFRVARTLAP